MKRIFILLIAIIGLLEIHLKSDAQACSSSIHYKPLPKMFVSRDTGISRIREMSRVGLGGQSKLKRLSSISGMQHAKSPFIYNWNAINNVVHQVADYDTMRLYFARYKQCGSLNFPLLANNNFILLFSPEVDRSTTQKYYFINEREDSNYEVSESCARTWITEFNSTCQTELRKTIIKSDHDNVDMDVPEKFSDTKSIIYSKTMFEEAFIEEKDYQKTHHTVDLAAFQFSLSAYSKLGRKRTPDDPHFYKRRLFIQMDYMKPNGNGGYDVFYLDDDDDFLCRAAQRAGLSFEKNRKFRKEQLMPLLFLNNGQLCPTFCPGK